jgi:hypothetical protein
VSEDEFQNDRGDKRPDREGTVSKRRPLRAKNSTAAAGSPDSSASGREMTTEGSLAVAAALIGTTLIQSRELSGGRIVRNREAGGIVRFRSRLAHASRRAEAGRGTVGRPGPVARLRPRRISFARRRTVPERREDGTVRAVRSAHPIAVRGPMGNLRLLSPVSGYDQSCSRSLDERAGEGRGRRTGCPCRRLSPCRVTMKETLVPRRCRGCGTEPSGADGEPRRLWNRYGSSEARGWTAPTRSGFGRS